MNIYPGDVYKPRMYALRRRLQHTRPAYVLDVRPNAQGRLRSP
jgi:hypothetical protein